MTTTPAAPSLIFALHARYEGNQADVVRIDENGKNDIRAQVAFEQSDLEFDALRLAILTQTPTTTAEAAILQYHIRVEHDWQATVIDRTTIGDRDGVLRLALDALFEFLASGADIPNEAVGPVFVAAVDTTCRASRRRRGDMS